MKKYDIGSMVNQATGNTCLDVAKGAARAAGISDAEVAACKNDATKIMNLVAIRIRGR